MKTYTSKLNAYLFLTLSLAGASTLRAQTILTLPASGTTGSGSTAVDFELRSDGSIVEEGAGTSTLTNTDLQASSRFLWIPSLSALCVGTGYGTETTSQVGEDSIALGFEALATQYNAIALGGNASATNDDAMALGLTSEASGIGAVAIGQFTSATGEFSTAMGCSGTASGEYSSVLGGFYSTATAYGATAIGYEVTAKSYLGLVLGAYNTGLSETGATPNLTTWVTTDPLVEVGNGMSSSTHSDAFIVYKNGDAAIQGKTTSGGGFVTTPASVSQTDIPMYTGN